MCGKGMRGNICVGKGCGERKDRMEEGNCSEKGKSGLRVTEGVENKRDFNCCRKEAESLLYGRSIIYVLNTVLYLQN